VVAGQFKQPWSCMSLESVGVQYFGLQIPVDAEARCV